MYNFAFGQDEVKPFNEDDMWLAGDDGEDLATLEAQYGFMDDDE